MFPEPAAGVAVDSASRNGHFPSGFPAAATLLAVTGSRAVLTTPDFPAPREVILMASGDYLGLGMHPSVVEAALRSTGKYGWGGGAGDPGDPWHAAHEELERRLAALVGAEAALLFASRYGALVTAVSSLLERGGVLLTDAPANEALAQGAYLAGGTIERLPHEDPRGLIHCWERLSSEGKKAVVALEGIYALDGHLSPLHRYLEITRRAGLTLLVDDTHGLGVVGESGRGSLEANGVRGKVDLLAGCLGRFLGGTGAFLAGTYETIEGLRSHARARLESAPPPAAASSSALAALRVMEMEPELRDALWENISYMRDRLSSLGFVIDPPASALIPLPLDDPGSVLRAKAWLLEHGLYVTHIVPPQVDESASRLRLSIKAHQTKEDLDRALDRLAEARERFNIAG